MRLKVGWSDKEMRDLGIGVLVESWDKLNTGRLRRKYNEEFTETERTYIRKFYNIAYGWLMRTGIPQETDLTLAQYQLIQRAVNFFYLEG